MEKPFDGLIIVILFNEKEVPVMNKQTLRQNAAYFVVYNFLHSSIGMAPRECYLKDFDTLRFVEKFVVEKSFLHRITQKVTPTATVSLFNVSYEVPQQYIGRTIHLRYRPEDMAGAGRRDRGKNEYGCGGTAG